MKIILHTEPYELLRKHVPVDGPAYAALLTARKVEGRATPFDQYWFDCTDVDADLYLAIAEELFPEYVKEIDRAVAQAVR